MRWDPLLAEAVARELDRTLHRARVRALLLEPEPRRVLLFLREGTLVLEMHPSAGWISLLDPSEPPTEARALPARILEVRALPDESALVFSLQRVRGRDEGLELVAEFPGNRWNALVVGHRTRQIRHVLLPREESSRSLSVGAPYRPPASTGRNAEPSPEWWIEHVAGRERSALLGQVAWTSSLNAPLFLAEDRVVAGVEGRARWLRMLDPEAWTPGVLGTGRGPQPYPVPLPGTDHAPADGLLEAMARARAEEEGPSEAALLVPAALLARGARRVERLRRRAAAMERELAQAEDPEPLRRLGDLLLARFGDIPRGASAVRLTGFAGESVEVELDPALPPQENAKRYYDEAARLDRARESLPKRIAKARAEAEEWEELLHGVRSGDRSAEALERSLGPPPTHSGRRGPTGEQESAGPFRRYRSSGGLEIRVGRGARQNDVLTFHHSAPDDIWLHVREAPGAHVILRWGRADDPPPRDLEEAAVLAALSSDARHSGTVPVAWTRRKYVRKPRKAGPGAVTPERVRTLFVRPDPEVRSRLQEDR